MGIFIKNAVIVINHQVFIERRLEVFNSSVSVNGNIEVLLLECIINIDTNSGRDPNSV